MLAERWIDAGYSVLVIDREGDHLGLAQRPGVHLIDAAAHLPSPTDLLAIAPPEPGQPGAGPVRSVRRRQARLRAAAAAAISAERARHGTPHWVIHDEAHQELWAADTQTAGLTVAEPGICLVTWQPDSLPEDLRGASGSPSPSPAAIRPVRPSSSRCRPACSLAGEDCRPFRVAERLSSTYAISTSTRRRRCRRSAASTSTTPTAKRRLSRQPGGIQPPPAPLRPGHLDYHLTRGDFSRWVHGTLADHELGAGLATIERDLNMRRASELEHARAHIVDAIERRYLRHADT